MEQEIKFALEKNIEKPNTQNDTWTFICLYASCRVTLSLWDLKYILRSEYRISRKNESCQSSFIKHYRKRFSIWGVCIHTSPHMSKTSEMS